MIGNDYLPEVSISVFDEVALVIGVLQAALLLVEVWKRFPGVCVLACANMMVVSTVGYLAADIQFSAFESAIRHGAFNRETISSVFDEMQAVLLYFGGLNLAAGLCGAITIALRFRRKRISA